MPETIHSATAQLFPNLSKSSQDLLAKTLVKAMDRPSQAPMQSIAAAENPAVARCCQAREAAMKAAEKYRTVTEGRAAYRNAMPPLSGAQNIRDFTACVAHGMLIDALDGSDGARLLYAAQLAYQMRDSRPHRKSEKAAPIRPIQPLDESITNA